MVEPAAEIEDDGAAVDAAAPPAAPPGIERPGWTRGAGSRPDLDPESDPRHFPCVSCGAELGYAIGQHELRCRHCGYRQTIEVGADEKPRERDYAAALERLEELRRRRAEPLPAEQVVTCDGCGAEVLFVGPVTATECAYCGRSIQRDDVHRDEEERLPVDGVLPFEVDREQATVALRRWVKSRWFAPGDFLRRTLRLGLHGVYLPYWTFDALTFTRFRGQRGDDYWVQAGSGRNARRQRRTRWSPASGQFQRFFDDVLCLALGGESAHLLPALEPWPLERLRPFRAEYLAGFEARTYGVPIEAGMVDARQRIEAALRSDVRQRIGGDRQRIEQMDVRYDAITYKHLLLPLWLLSYRHGDKVYRVAVNAVTGRVYGERPWSAGKIALLVAAITLVVLGVLAIRALGG